MGNTIVQSQYSFKKEGDMLIENPNPKNAEQIYFSIENQNKGKH